jgi:hypothetical protein
MNPETLTWTAGPLRLAVRRQLVRWSDHRAPGRCPVCMVDTPNRARPRGRPPRGTRHLHPHQEARRMTTRYRMDPYWLTRTRRGSASTANLRPADGCRV